MKRVSASILEIFPSRQGEGLCVGNPHLFIRFGGCNLACDYCDTPESIPAKSGTLFSIQDVLTSVDRFEGKGNFGDQRVISLTGGEPLLHVSFLEHLIPPLRKRGWQIYLETNGTLPRALAKIVAGCDWIAMDFKLETATGHDLWEAHQWFLEIGGDKVFVKMVLTDTSKEEEFYQGVERLKMTQPDTPLILQPATPWGATGSIPLERLTCWWAWAARRLRNVPIIPQVHRLWAIA